MKRWLIILTIVFTLVGIVIVYFDWDRTIRLSMSSINDLIDVYSMKPKSETRRVVAVIDCDDGVNNGNVCNKTLKSILDQSMRLHDIAVQTNTPRKIDQGLLKVVSLHRPGTELVREMERDTIILKLKNGVEYPFDYVENQLEIRE
jgi:hypothetical protein